MFIYIIASNIKVNTHSVEGIQKSLLLNNWAYYEKEPNQDLKFECGYWNKFIKII